MNVQSPNLNKKKSNINWVYNRYLQKVEKHKYHYKINILFLEPKINPAFNKND